MTHFEISEELPYQIGSISLTAGKRTPLSIHYTAICFITETNVNITTESLSEDKKIAKGQLFLLPPALPCTLTSESDCDIIYLEIPDLDILYMHHFSGTHKINQVDINHLFSTLEITGTIVEFVHSLSHYLREKIDTPILTKLKSIELLWILNHYYSEDILCNFLSPVLSNNYKFTLFVLTHYQQVSSSKELAFLSNYSLPHFERLFRKIFNQSPYQWMLDKKIKNVYKEVRNSSKPLKLIADQYGFASVANFGDFCRKHFGESPSNLRKRVKQ